MICQSAISMHYANRFLAWDKNTKMRRSFWCMQRRSLRWRGGSWDTSGTGDQSGRCRWSSMASAHQSSMWKEDQQEEGAMGLVLPRWWEWEPRVGAESYNSPASMSRSGHGWSSRDPTAIQYCQDMLDGNFMSCFYNIIRSSRPRMSREASAMRRRKIWGTAPKCWKDWKSQRILIEEQGMSLRALEQRSGAPISQLSYQMWSSRSEQSWVGISMITRSGGLHKQRMRTIRSSSAGQIRQNSRWGSVCCISLIRSHCGSRSLATEKFLQHMRPRNLQSMLQAIERRSGRNWIRKRMRRAL